ncbi:unnamed protein product [Mytilus edulis]|uniref:B box-type domain-containing protein n=1 Tax=Mytilus edulis TaxID=6550 RepID=A0A8S3TMB5_MYTED|nr:unnamed protein product [Mytilus edulis]
MSDLVLCGPCFYVDKNRNAQKWCTVCEEGLCADCEKVHKSIKTTRDHRLIPAEDYHQIKRISISLNCEDHDKRLELYCKTHDVAFCINCFPSHHGACPDVIPLDKAAENAKRSTAIDDLENALNRTLQNLLQIISDRGSELNNLDDYKRTIKKKINDTRERIMKKIEDLEQKATSRIRHAIQGDLCCLREQTSQLKSFASDVQIFLGTRQINETFSQEVESVKEVIQILEKSEICLQLHPSAIALMNEVDQLGEISLKKTITSLPFIEANVDQAQVQLRNPLTKSIENVHIELKERFEVKQKGFFTFELTGCTVLTNGNLLMANNHGNTILMEYSEDGKRIHDIPCSSKPFDLTVIDTDRIAVTYGDKKYVEILNLKKNTVEKEVEFENDCYGISYQDNKLFIIITGGIVITDIEGKVLKTFYFECEMYIETTKDRIYFTTKRRSNCKLYLHGRRGNMGCVPSRHRTCSDVMPLDKTAETAKRSTALADLEDSLTITLQNIQQTIYDRAAALKNLDGQKRKIKNTIKDTRARILKKLDDFEQKLLLVLDTQHERTIDRIYFTVEKDKNAHYISMADEAIWVHKVESLVDPRGITVDDHQNVFVVDQNSDLLTVIQHDGKAS